MAEQNTISKALTDKRLYFPLLIAILVLIVMFSFLLSRGFKKTLYAERKEMLSMVSNSAAENFKQIIQSQWSMYNLSYSIASECANEMLDIPKSINEINMKHDFGTNYYFLVDDAGRYYCSDGVSGKLDDFTYYMTNSNDRIEYLGNLPHLNPRKSYMIYRGRFDEKILMETDGGERAIEYFAYAQDLTDLKNSILGMFEVASNIFINDSKGALLFEEYGLNKLIEGNNLFKKFYMCGFPFGEHPDEIENSCKRGEPTVCALKIKGEEYYFCSEPIGISGWSLSMILPSQGIKSTIAGEIGTLITYILVILFLVGIALVYITYSAKIRSQEDRLKKSEELVAAIEEASQAKSVFLSNMSHDIRTPINGIMGVTAIAKTSVDNPTKVSECLDKIDKASSHLLSLINDVLDMSRIENGRTTINSLPANMEDICESCSEIIRGQLTGRDIKFTTEISVSHPDIFADEVHLRRILINILGNAVKFTRDGGRISFRCRETDCTDTSVTMRFIIKDTGIGMSRKFLDKLFDAFTQEENRERSAYSGTGLGMAITKQLVDLMGGTIEVESEVNKGSSFYVTITFKRNLEKSDKHVETNEEASIEGMKILLVEDNELNMEITETILTMNGAIVDKAWDGFEAIDKFTSKDIGTYDVIIMDIMMPRMNGLEAARAIRSVDREDAATIPIIAMTANAFEDDIKATSDAGMNAHLIKPVDMDSVKKTIVSLTNSSRIV